MGDAENAGQTTLWDDPEGMKFGSNPTEKAVMTALEELHTKDSFTGAQKALAQICVSLARSIDLGNNKGRAVANEATQLAALIDRLAGVETEEIDDSNIPEATRRLMDALESPPRLDTPSASYTP